MKRSTILIAVGLVVAVAVALVLVFTVGKSNDSKNKSDGPGSTTTKAPSPADASSGGGASDVKFTTSAAPPGVTTTPVPSPKSDPEASKAVLTMLAIGDWGSTTGKISGSSLETAGLPGSCCKTYGGSGENKNKVNPSNARIKVDYWAQNHVANLLAKSAGELKPARIIGHGDNVYWNGIGPEDAATRMEDTFEKKYNHPELKGIKWLNVAGNHDIGGAEYICGEKDNEFRECKSPDELVKYLNGHFDLMKNYKSPNADRWSMKDHYYVESVKSTDGSVSVDIFNIDTNHADSHGLRQVCCQCYGYSRKYPDEKKSCENVERGDKLCAGGDGAMYDACAKEINGWADDSYKQAARDLKASTATYKIINTHYSPHFHMDVPKMNKWFNLTKEMDVHAWFNGHTHGFNHDITAWGTHFFENGGGGGIYTQTSSIPAKELTDQIQSAWVAGGNPYGFMELSFDKDWLKVNFASFDNAWSFGGYSLEGTKVGGIARGHCYYIPSIRGTVGQKCKNSVDTPIGQPIMPDNGPPGPGR